MCADGLLGPSTASGSTTQKADDGEQRDTAHVHRGKGMRTVARAASMRVQVLCA